MSLTMMALRIAAVQALKAGGTLVGNNVLDSQISAIDHTADGQLRSDQERPFIAVYTDSAKAQNLGQTGLRANGKVDIMLNCGVSATMAQTDAETGETEIVDLFPATDAHLEAVLDAIDVQIMRVLSDPENPWAQIFGDFVLTYSAKEHLRSSSAADSVRIAAGQTKLTVEVHADPRFGQPLPEGGVWQRFMALMEANNLSQLALFQQLIGDPAPGDYPEYERLTGMTSAAAQNLKLYTFGGVPKSVKISETSTETSAV